MVIFSANSVDSNTYENSNRVDYLIDSFNIYEQDTVYGELLLKYNGGAPWSRFIKHDIIEKHNIVFDEIVRHNDVRFVYLASYYSSNCTIDRTAIYCVTNRETSISKNKSQEALLASISVFGAMNTFYEQNNISFKTDRHLRQLAHLFINDRKGFMKGKDILIKIGYKPSFIYFSIAKRLIKVFFKKIFCIK